MNVLEELLAKWKGDGIANPQGASAAEIAMFEQKHSIELEVGFREYLRIVNGMAAGCTDDQLMCFLSLDAIDDAMQSFANTISSNDVLFAEYSVFAHCYVLRLDVVGRGRVLATDGSNERPLAQSFVDFLRVYLKDPRAVANCFG